MIAGIVLMFRILPGSFVPDEDQGYFFVIVEVPDTASLAAYVGSVARSRSQNIIAAGPGGAGRGTGQRLQPASTASYEQRRGCMFVSLKPFEERKDASLLASPR